MLTGLCLLLIVLFFVGLLYARDLTLEIADLRRRVVRLEQPPTPRVQRLVQRPGREALQARIAARQAK